MNQTKYIAMGVGIFALFLSVCGGAFYMGTQKDMSEDTIGTAFVEAVDGLYHSLEGVDTSGKELRLQDYSGEVSLRLYNEVKTLNPGMRLENQDRLATALDSSAYLTMDQTRVMRLNEESEVTVTQGGEALSFHLAEGTVFFNVTEPLLSTETLEFSTNNVVTGVRGTSGIITFSFDGQGQAVSQIALLTGVLDCYAIDSTTTERPQFFLEAGQVAIVTSLEDGTVDIEILELEQENLLFFLPDDFIDTIQGDLHNEGQSVPLSEYLRDDELDYLSLYQEILDEYRGYDVYTELSYALADIDGDGVKELFIYAVEEDYFTVFNLYTLSNGAVLSAPVYTFGDNIHGSVHEGGYLQQFGKSGFGNYSTEYYRLHQGEFVGLASSWQEYDPNTNDVTYSYTPDQATFEMYQPYFDGTSVIIDEADRISLR